MVTFPNSGGRNIYALPRVEVYFQLLNGRKRVKKASQRCVWSIVSGVINFYFIKNLANFVKLRYIRRNATVAFREFVRPAAYSQGLR